MPARVLILDEDPVLCELYRTSLEGRGYTTIVATALPEIAAVADLQPDLILLDYFHGATPPGWIFLIQLKTFAETEHIPVVVCTSDREAVNAQVYDLAIFDVNVVYKPFDMHDFLSAIHYSLPSKHAMPDTLYERTRNDSAASYPARQPLQRAG